MSVLVTGICLSCPGGDVFFTELFQINTDGAREWVSDGGVAVYVPSFDDETWLLPLSLPPELRQRWAVACALPLFCFEFFAALFSGT